VSVRLGIKVGPDDWQDKLRDLADPNCLPVEHVEVYLNLARFDAYVPLLSWLRERGMSVGLHASTSLADGLMLNLGSPDPHVRAESASLLERTIDVGAETGMRHVVVHPGSCRDWEIRGGRTYCRGAPATPQERDRHVIDALLRLAAHAAGQGVALLAENMPAYDFAAYEPPDRIHVVDVGFVPYRLLAQLGQRGVGLCVDLGHLYAEMSALGPGVDPTPQVMAATRALAPYAGLVHLSTVVPPWNGTDSHNGFLDADYALGAIPGRAQLLAWLELFPGDGLCAVPEPSGGAAVHLDNVRVLRSWMEPFA
jgi:sugar phosphate isomerase/epimerase